MATSKIKSGKPGTIIRRVIALVLILTMCICTIPSAVGLKAEATNIYPYLSDSCYAEYVAPYTISCWANSACTVRGNFSRSNYNACATKGDKCRIISVNSSYTIWYYPAGSTMTKAYVKTADIFKSINAPEYVISRAKVPVNNPAKSNGSYGEIWVNDQVYRFGADGNYYVACYDSRSGNRAYKIGLVTKSDWDKVAGKTDNSTISWQWPMDNAKCSWRGYNNSTWSWSEHKTGGSGGRNYHLGLDLKGSNNNVYAAAAGKVVACSSSNSGANGRYVIIQHSINGKTVYSFYAHLASLNVSKNTTVSKGTRIGTAGGSGYGSNSYYGTHLHFAIVDTLWSGGGYWGYAYSFSGNSKTYDGVTYYNPKYVVENKRLP